MIVRRVTQIHGSYHRLGTFERVSIERWRALNPEIEYQFITDADIDPWIESSWPDYAEMYRGMYPICRAGVQRLSAVLRWGGLYADCGTYPIRPINQFQPADIWDRELAMFKLKDRPGTGQLVTDCIFAAEAGNSFIRGLVEEIFRRTANPFYVKKWADYGHRGYVFDTASVHVFSEYAEQCGVIAVNGLPDADATDIRNCPEKLNTYRYSTECWLEDNRFVTQGIDKHKDEMGTLQTLKETYGI